MDGTGDMGVPSQTPARPDGKRRAKQRPAQDSVALEGGGSPLAAHLRRSIHVPDHALLRVVGRGAYGEVWLARSVLGTPRAVKVVHLHDFTDSQPFDREFRGIQKYEPVSRSHEGLIDILQVGRNDAEGYFYYVMELADPAADGTENASPIDGDEAASAPRGTGPAPPSADPLHSTLGALAEYAPRTLRHELRSRHRLPVGECLQVGLVITGAVEHLHRAGLVHRDIKPSNIIFVGGRPKLADIGLIADMDDAHSVVGTEGYLPPEGCGTPEADLYSLGKVLYEMSTGFDRRSFPELPAEITDPTEAFRLRELNEIILKACARDPGRRHTTATALRLELERLQLGRSIRRRRRWEKGVHRLRGFVPVAAFVALGLAVALQFTPRRRPMSAAVIPERASVFVLPFRPVKAEDLPGGLRHHRMTDAFIDALASLDGVRRSPRRSGWVGRDEEELRQSLARTNAMRHVLSGHLDEQAGRLSLRLRLYQRNGDRLIWDQTFFGETNDVVGLEREALARLSTRLGLRLVATEEQRIEEQLQDNAEAGRLLAEGDLVYEVGSMVPKSYTQIIAFAEEARRIDPHFLDARCRRAEMLRDLAMLGRAPSEVWPDIERELAEILRVDETHPAALNQMAGCRLFSDWDWGGFDTNYQRQLLWEPGVGNHFIRALWLRSHGLLEEARSEQTLSETPECTHVAGRFHGATARWVQRDYEEGIRYARRTLELYPDSVWPWYCLAMLLVDNGDYNEALRAIDRIQLDTRIPMFIGLRGYTFARMGESDKARLAIEELKALEQSVYIQPYFVARIYGVLGDRNQALHWLELAERDRSEYLVFADVGGLRTDPAWDQFQEDPRFQALLKRVGLDTWPVPIRELR